jgi:hypothetical protein
VHAQRFLQFLGCLVKEKKIVSKAASQYLFRSFAVVGQCSPVFCIKSVNAMASFWNNFQNHRQLSNNFKSHRRPPKSQIKLPEEGYVKDFQNYSM